MNRLLASILFALIAPSIAHADDGARPAGPPTRDRAPLRVMIRGADSEADGLRGRIAKELGVPIEVATDNCDAPCLVVAFEGDRRASVIFTPANGPLRARTVELGPDPAQWPLVVTLLAGNVVRDEAADVMAQLPVPPPEAQAVPVDPGELDAVTPPPPPPPLPPPSYAPSETAPLLTPLPEAPRPTRLFGFGFVPGLSTDFTQVGRINHFLSLDLIAGVSGGSSGITISGVADIERGPVSGFQVGGVTTIARNVSGMQLAGVAAGSGDLQGVQVAGTAAIADFVEGAQVGGVAAVARKADLQIGGVATVARGRASTQLAGVAASANGAANIQIAGVAAAATGATNIQAAGVASVAQGANVQVGGVASVSRGTANIQVAGVVNVAGRLQGFQVAPINVARRVDGVQIGVVNIGSSDGFSFGLINIVPGGRADVEATVDTSRVGTLLFRHGGRRWHNVYGIGGHPFSETNGDREDVWMYGLGFGPSWRAGSTVFDLELVGWEVSHGAKHNTDLSLLSQLRLSIAYGVGPFKVVAGGALNAYISDDTDSPLMIERRTTIDPMDTDVHVTWWPSAFLGLRI